jgi:serine/threonine-protein kinase HipA
MLEQRAMWRISNGRLDQLIVFINKGGRSQPVGQLLFEGGARKRFSTFSYARSWFDDPDHWALAPVYLPIRRKAVSSVPFEVPLPFCDAGPDAWGKTILNHAYPNQSFGMGEYLAASSDNRTGELSFGHSPDKPPEVWRPETRGLIDLPDDSETLEDLLAAADALEDGKASRHHIQLLLRSGTDVGGARPKVRLRRADGSEWIAKFPTSADTFDDPKVEAVCLSLAQQAGIEVPAHELVTIAGKTVLLVGRFDRSATGERLGYSSAATLLGQEATGYGTNYTYVDIAAKARAAGIKPCEAELFRRLLFNCFIHNTDDHLRNHAFLRDANGWRLSPAFDLVPGRDRRLVLRPGIGIDPQPDPISAASAYKQFKLPDDEARRIYDEVSEAMQHLHVLLDAFDVGQDDRNLFSELMPSAFTPPRSPLFQTPVSVRSAQ